MIWREKIEWESWLYFKLANDRVSCVYYIIYYVNLNVHIARCEIIYPMFEIVNDCLEKDLRILDSFKRINILKQNACRFCVCVCVKFFMIVQNFNIVKSLYFWQLVIFRKFSSFPYKFLCYFSSYIYIFLVSK